MNDTEAAWAAGLFEGEGHIADRPYRGRAGRQRQLVLKMTDEDIIRRLHAVTGCGQVYALPPQREHYKPQWSWQCTRWEDIERVLTAMLPWFGARRGAAARALLLHPARRVGGVPTETCSNGHRWSDPGVTYISPTGVRGCRPCRTRRTREHRQARKAA